MRTIPMLAMAIAAPSLALAQDNVMAARFGNTIVTHTGGGHEVHMYYKEDHTFTGKVVDADFALKGTWAVNGGTVCLTYNPPPPTITNPVCQPVAAHKIGDTWAVGKNTVTLVAGIQ